MRMVNRIQPIHNSKFLVQCSTFSFHFRLSLAHFSHSDYDIAVRIPLTKHGLPQVVILPAIVLVVMFVCLVFGPRFFGLWLTVVIEMALPALFVWVLSFFRDPARAVPQDKDVLLAPADGRITNIETVQEDTFIGADALRIGIFLGLFDVHINRSPCAARVEKITYKRGRFKNAMKPASGRVNESNNLALTRLDEPRDKLLVRQISGAVARRIVCTVKQGQKLAGGENFGMIKFGSRTELYVPVRENAKCLVKMGDNVKAGLTVLVRYDSTRPAESVYNIK